MEFDLKTMNSVMEQLADERGIPREKMLEAVEGALATAYKREFGKREQIVKAHFNSETGDVDFYQIKTVVDATTVRADDAEETVGADGELLPLYNEEKHIMLADAARIKRGAALGDEIVFPLEKKTTFGRIAAQTAKQVIMQKIREAERASVLTEFGGKEGDIVNGIVQRVERGNLYIDLGRATGIMPFHEQIPGERYRPGERIRAYLFSVEEGMRGVYLRLSRAHPEFLKKLFEMEVPELQSGIVVIKALAREAGGRTKLAVVSTDPRIDPVGTLVGQRGVRVNAVMSELGGERIDIMEWSENATQFIQDALSPAQTMSVTLNEEDHRAQVEVTPDQQSLAIGRGGQNVRLAAKLTGWAIDIRSQGGETVADTPADVEPVVEAPVSDVDAQPVDVPSDVSDEK
jgi:transcription termination/antitermination protein NusA